MSNYKMKEMNPFIRARQYAAELKEKKDKTGTPLTNTQLSFRSGYCQAMRDFAYVRRQAVTANKNNHGYMERSYTKSDFEKMFETATDFSGNDIF